MKIRGNQPGSRWTFAFAAALAAHSFTSAQAAETAPAPPAPQLTYADLADLSDSAKLVVKVQIRKQKTLPPEYSPALRQGWVRQIFETQTLSLISGHTAVGESLRFLADVPLDAKGKPPKLAKQAMIVFALPVPGKPGDLQLIDVDSYTPADPATEARIRAVLTELVAPDAAPKITGVRDALSVEGNLAGESETQVFLDTDNGEPVTLSVVRRPNMEPEWGVSWTELVDQSAQPPMRDTLQWYRLACFLPASLPYDAIISTDGQSRVAAARDYRYVLDQLGACSRIRGGPPKFFAAE